MILIDKNQTLQPPEGELTSVISEGSYLRVSYCLEMERTPECVTKHYTTVYLNDQGREVARTLEELQYPVYPVEEAPTPQERPPVGFWYRFCAGFDLMLLGFWEIISCFPVKGAKQ
jgi:hypothetical protein